MYLVVNAPGFFPFAWRLVKGFLDEKTQRSVKVVSRAEQYQILSELIDVENIPSYLGGKCTCEEFGGDCMTSDKGPWSNFEHVPPRWVKKREDLDNRTIEQLDR